MDGHDGLRARGWVSERKSAGSTLLTSRRRWGRIERPQVLPVDCRVCCSHVAAVHITDAWTASIGEVFSPHSCRYLDATSYPHTCWIGLDLLQIVSRAGNDLWTLVGVFYQIKIINVTHMCEHLLHILKSVFASDFSGIARIWFGPSPHCELDTWQGLSIIYVNINASQYVQFPGLQRRWRQHWL